MKDHSKFEELNDTPLSIIIVDEKLNAVYSNNAAKKAFNALCKQNGVLKHVDNPQCVTDAIKSGQMKQVRSEKPNGFNLLCFFPFLYGREKLALVLAESSFSLYKSTNGFEKEMIESYAFQQMMLIGISGIETVVTALEQRFDRCSDIMPYLERIKICSEKLNRLAESVIAAERIQRLFSEFHVEAIDVEEALWNINRRSHIFDLSNFNEPDGKIMYNKMEFTSVIDDISDYLLIDSDGNNLITVKSVITDTSVILEFSIFANGKNLPETEWNADPRKGFRNGLSFAEKIAAARGGSVKARKRGAAIQVLYTIRKLLPTDYSGYIAQPKLID